jgi:hypothetical protein
MTRNRTEPITITSPTREATVTIWPDGSMTRGDVEAHLATRLRTLTAAAGVLGMTRDEFIAARAAALAPRTRLAVIRADEIGDRYERFTAVLDDDGMPTRESVAPHLPAGTPAWFVAHDDDSDRADGSTALWVVDSRSLDPLAHILLAPDDDTYYTVEPLDGDCMVVTVTTFRLRAADEALALRAGLDPRRVYYIPDGEAWYAGTPLAYLAGDES